MARKNKLTSTNYRGVKEVLNLQGTKDYIVSFTYKGFRINEKNFTKLFNCKTAKQAYEKSIIIKEQISNGEDPFSSGTSKIDSLVPAYLDTRSVEYRKNSLATYNKWIKPVIGHKFIDKVTEEDLIKIRTSMEQQGLKESTIKKIRNILSPVFIKALRKGQIKVDVIKLVPMGRHLVKPRLEERLNGSLEENIKKIFNAIKVLEEDKNDEEYKAIFLISLMCARRLGEILLIEYEDIIDGIVHVRGSTTKTFKSEGENVVERYPLPREVLKIINKNKGTGLIFKHRARSCMDKYREMIENECKLDYKKRGKEFPIRTHDNRHFIMSLCSEKFGSNNVGQLALSHREKNNMNDVYLTVEYKRVEKLYKYYWKLLRN